MIRSEYLERAIQRGIEFLRKNQLPSGEFKTMVARDAALTVEARHDASPFATAHIVSSLADCNLEESAPLIKSAAIFLSSQCLAGGVWKFWTKNHPGFRSIPADMDDTCVVSMALRDAKADIPQNIGILIGNTDEHGRFLTWIQPRRLHLKKASSWWPLLTAAPSVFGRRNFFRVGEARRNDVDAVVNANVICRLAKHQSATSKAVEWLYAVVQAGEEELADRYYQSRFALYYAICRGLRENIAALSQFQTFIQKRLDEQINPDGSIGQTAQDTALAIVSLAAVGEGQEILERAACFLLLQQQQDGSWPTHSYYYGGFQRARAWGSCELTTGFCIEALVRFAQLRE